MTIRHRPVAHASQLVFLFADLQPPLIEKSGTNPPELIDLGAGTLADGGALLDVPMLFSLVPEDDGASRVIPQLERHASDRNRFVRRSASPFDDPTLVEAIRATGRRSLVIAGYATEAVTLFAALDGIASGFDVHVALDAGGGRSERTEAAVLRRLERAGVVVTSVADVLMSAAPDFSGLPGKDILAIVSDLMAAH